MLGYDCHGLPIELKVDRELGPKKRDMSLADFRRACRAYATRFIDVMSVEFQRLGVFGDWDHLYLTMDFRYQAAIARALGKFVERGLVYKGKKPVHWCIHCRTALAEAEVEYDEHSSPSIYVEFPLSRGERRRDLATRVPALAGRPVSVLIWTTTPWTIPSNLAIAFHPEFDYAAYDVDGRAVIVAEALAPRVAAATGKVLGEPVAKMKGADLEHMRFVHPLYARDSVGVLADYVTLEQGTGAVHTAPGHGSDDFATGVKYGLEIYAPVGPGGHFLDTVELFDGQRVFDANPVIVKALEERGRLWHHEAFHHSYPHCWRCHNPVIFLATSQWFIRMDGQLGDSTLRATALEAVDNDVEWLPSWGRERLSNMIANRPDWCISRQRAWGVPIPAVDCTKCGEAVLTPALVERAAGVFDEHGADAWYERPIAEFLPDGLTCPACGGTEFERERDILDVWFDSGSSHEAVLPFRPELTWPADLYLEGSDQHRGWFQSSLLVGLGTRGRPPFKRGRDARLRRRRRRPEDVEVARQHDPAAGHHQGERRRDHPALGRDGRLPRGSSRRQADPRARRRGLSQDSEYAALPGVEPLRLRSASIECPSISSKRWTAMRSRATVRRRRRSSTRTGTTTIRRSSRRSTSSRPSISARSTPTSRRIGSTRLARHRPSAARRRRRCTSSPTAWRACWRRSSR